jgi:hypothetical protein
VRVPAAPVSVFTEDAVGG